jgi:glycosyltransferase involved in cell wall biosynthesis
VPPRISVIVTTYNQAAYIAPALDSVLAQTSAPDEIVVVDDGSTDATPDVIAPYRDRIMYIHQPNQGVAQSRNTGIRATQGDLLAFLDGDDLWEPDKLAVQMAAAAAHPQSALVAVNGIQFSETRITRDSLFPPQIARLFELGRESSVSVDASELLLHENVVWTTSQIMIPAWVFREVGLSDPQYPLVNDWDLYLRIADRHPVTFVNRPLMRWRYHERSASGPAFSRQLRWGEDGIHMMANYICRIPRARRRAARRALRSQIFETARAAYDRTRPGHREVGLGSLRRLLRWSHVSPAPAMFLLAAYLPDRLTHALGRVMRSARHVS